jgi:hypothetical protein
MQIIAFIFAALLGIGSIYWFGSYNPLEEIAEEIIEKEVGLEKETSK